jgi:hypothetical protein
VSSSYGRWQQWLVCFNNVSPISPLLDLVNINFLALDFDQTIIDIHTGGKWAGTADELLPSVRPMFRYLIPAALEEGFSIAVVTFSAQTELIQQVMENLTDKAAEIPIRGGFPGRTFVYEGQGSTQGKQAHMASAVEELEERKKGLEVTRDSTLLIDDDAKNIRHALQNGTRAIWLNPDKSSELLKDMQNLI